MIVIQENALEKEIEEFNNCSVRISFNGIITGRIEAKKCFCKYDMGSGRIEIKDTKTDNTMCFEISSLYRILKDENKMLELYMDYELRIRIEKIKKL